MSDPRLDNASRGNALTVVNAIFFTLVVLLVTSRLWYRGTRKLIGLDDILILVAFLFSIGHTITSQLNMRYGGDRHVWTLSLVELSDNIHALWGLQICFVGAVCFVKLSILAYYRRISTTSQIYGGSRKLSTILLILAIANIISFIPSIILLIAACRPTKYFWTQFLPNARGHCVDTDIWKVTHGSYNTFLDFATLAVSPFLVSKLEIPKCQRKLIMLLLGAGIITCIAGVTRTVKLAIVLYRSNDKTWDSYSVYIAGIVEVDLAIVCACLPACKPLVEGLLERKMCGNSAAKQEAKMLSSISADA